jgi:hypothetical protein
VAQIGAHEFLLWVDEEVISDFSGIESEEAREVHL